MRSWVILMAVLVVVVSAEHNVIIEGLQKRPEILDDDDICKGALVPANSIYSGLPMPPPSLVTMSLPFDACATSIAFSGDASVASQFSSYTSEVKDWYTSHRAQLQSALASCTSLASFLTMDIPVCLSSISDLGPTSAANPTLAATPTPSATSNAASRKTGARAGAAAAAGLLGVVAAL
ncbi:hypothetical protein F4820DRAFT_138720 [Hypoxylon rubiginosum]|uniref:Uncharacterized protein n=1 Tax=Hypoxylon rubiginosum TaxID=110542 RepID=A0ACB9YL49_9PEZI|nr:hypothetical protein F4820DRAFT_138720 [Hypoxylon rubiginosum]